MRIIKYFFLLIITLVIASSIFISTLSSEFIINKKIDINTPKEVVFDYISNFENWHHWEFLNTNNIEVSNIAIEASEGLKFKTSNYSGTLKNKKLHDKDSINQVLYFNEIPQNVIWKFSEKDSTTSITIRVNGSLSFLEKASLLITKKENNKKEEFLNSFLLNISKEISHHNNKLKITPIPLKIYKDKNIQVASYDYNNLEKFLKRKNDTTYIYNFWATWCAPCIEELPYFEKLQENYKSQNVKVVLISLDFTKLIETNLMTFLHKNNLKSEVIHLNDPNSDYWINKINPNWSGAIPATLIFNKDRKEFYEKSFNYEELEKTLQPFILKDTTLVE